MAHLLEWEGNILRGPFNLWVGKTLADLPRGPSKAGPFSSVRWAFGFTDNATLRKLRLECKEPFWLSDDVDLDFTVRPGKEASARGAGAIRVRMALTGGKSGTNYYAPTDQIQMGRHRGTDSIFGMRVTSLDSTRFQPAPAPAQFNLTAYLRDQALSPLPFDVRFSFPNCGRDLWANSAILRAKSGYFIDLPDSGFAESSSETVVYPAAITCPIDTHSSGSTATPQGTTPHPQQRVHTIEITDHSFGTYHAVWIWMLTGQLNFTSRVRPPSAQPSSEPDAPEDPQPSSAKRRRLVLNPSLAKQDATPAASPAAVYRLAHILDLNGLARDALEGFEAGLTVENVALELSSPAADLYSAIRGAAAEFAVRHWGRVKETVGMKALQAKVEAREFEQGAVVMKALADAALAGK